MPPDKVAPLKHPRLRVRPKEGSPFYPLVYYVYAKIQCVNLPLPDIPSDITSPHHWDLYVLAICHLAQIKSLGRKLCVPEEVLIMLSGVVNACWPPALLAISLAPHIEDMSLVPTLEAVNPIVTLLKGELLSALCPGINGDPDAVPSIASFNTMIASRLTVLAITQEEHNENLAFTVLRLMQHLALLARYNNAHMKPDFFSIWRYVLQDILAGPPDLSIELLEMEGTLMPLRVSCDVIGYGQADIGVYLVDPHHVPPSQPSDTPTRLALRTVRDNAKISLALEKRHIDTFSSFPIIAETRDSRVTLYSIRRYGDVFGVGLATRETITVPTNVQEFKSFLQSNSLDILLAFGEHMRTHATHVRDVLEATKRDDRAVQPLGAMPHVVFLPFVQEDYNKDMAF
ncbi:hypothetical protein BGZ93_008537 [Podila epicladia]|nr:hypothetical protein BGZ92_001751 [Podila epicladia]KAG0092011.1 hypothetical protein BGZ93_008537 [Podila epicladia]